MSGITHEYMEQYLRSLIPDSIGILKDLEEFAIENSVPIVQKETAKFLQFMVTLKKTIKDFRIRYGYRILLHFNEFNLRWKQ